MIPAEAVGPGRGEVVYLAGAAVAVAAAAVAGGSGASVVEVSQAAAAALVLVRFKVERVAARESWRGSGGGLTHIAKAGADKLFELVPAEGEAYFSTSEDQSRQIVR